MDVFKTFLMVILHRKNASILNILPCFPRSGGESVGFGRERPHRANIDDVSRQLGLEHHLDVSADLHVVATSGRAQVRYARDLVGESVASEIIERVVTKA